MSENNFFGGLPLPENYKEKPHTCVCMEVFGASDHGDLQVVVVVVGVVVVVCMFYCCRCCCCSMYVLLLLL